MVTVNERQAQLGEHLRQGRTEVYEAARNRNPHRWSGRTRDWNSIDTVHLNPDTL